MAMAAEASTMTLLPPDAKPPKSKSAPYYAVHPNWQDVSPIPQVDQTGALAAIAYSPRYSEAMSYLRSLMAENEVSQRALALTEDLISMNPAHYTVWIYRMRILRELWLSKGDEATPQSKVVEVEGDNDTTSEETTQTDDIDKDLWANLQVELKWLDEVSFRNLKNYQIWHHRHALADLLPADPAIQNRSLTDSTQQTLSRFVASEQSFLAQILSLDTKNYHVWSYRQWLCTRFPSFLLPSHSSPGKSIAPSYRSHPEVQAIESMITDDLRNNSAWSHRYFLLFGHRELDYAQTQDPPLILKSVNEDKLLHKAGLIDNELVAAEIEFTKDEIRKAPQNGSTWNYLRGVLRHGDVDIITTLEFCEEFLGPNRDLWMDQWVEVENEDAETGKKIVENQEIGVRSSHAVEWLSEIYAADGSNVGRARAKECLRSLSEKWDIVRRGYWQWQVEKLEQAGL